MPVHLYWGEDDFSLEGAVKTLRARVVDPAWETFNLQQYGADGLVDALNEAVTPPFGAGGRLVRVHEAGLFREAPDATVWAECERTLPRIPKGNHLLFTQAAKPNGTLKATKLLTKIGAEVREFALVAPWLEDKLREQVGRMAAERGVRLTPGALELLAGAVGNDVRRLDGELTKLALYADGRTVDESAISALTVSGAQTSFKLSSALLAGRAAEALDIVEELLRRNEPALRILAVLTNQMRTWLWVRLMVEAGERDNQKIAVAAEIGNPKRVFFLQKEVERTPATRLGRVLPLLLDAEVGLKSGRDDRQTLQMLVLRACEALAPAARPRSRS